MRRYFSSFQGLLLPLTGGLSIGVYLRHKQKVPNVYALSDKEVAGPDGAYSPPSDDNLVVRNVQIFVRHGARTPLKVLPYLDQASWSLETLMADPPEYARYPFTVHDFHGKPLSMGLFETLSRNVIFPGGCFAGQLTLPGKRQMYQLGQRLRKEYINDQKFLSPSYSSKEVYVRSTNITRTIESAMWMVSGIYNATKEDLEKPDVPVIPVFATTEQEEILYPNHSFCNALTRLSKRIMQHMHEITGMLDDRDLLEKQIDFDTTKGRLSFVDLRDELAARLAHDMDMPPVLRQWWDKVDGYAVQVLARMVKGNDPSSKIQREVLRLACGPVVEMVLGNMSGVVQHRNGFKLEVYSCHDSMMIALIIALDIWDGKWPPYAADLRFELLEDRTNPGEYFVRVRYLGDAKVLSALHSEEVKEMTTVYPLKDFTSNFIDLAISSRHHREQCQVRTDYTDPLTEEDDDEGSYFIAAKPSK
ncbi:hypothetical protein RvY_18796 [Ramazzottius varieornatus]|uniref:Acid phosphatase n=1 Tax=Ramazzottius varieornatus TaxID=947166 RepID=A0A1D1W747_RAMVA|nr:hypothetical protein RvY_18796 [Ramazzottius varieornatus]